MAKQRVMVKGYLATDNSKTIIVSNDRDLDIFQDIVRHSINDEPSFVRRYKNNNVEAESFFKDGNLYRGTGEPYYYSYFESGQIHSLMYSDNDYQQISKVFNKDGSLVMIEVTENYSGMYFNCSDNGPAFIRFYENGFKEEEKYLKYPETWCRPKVLGPGPNNILYHPNGKVYQELFWNEAGILDSTDTNKPVCFEYDKTGELLYEGYYINDDCVAKSLEEFLNYQIL